MGRHGSGVSKLVSTGLLLLLSACGAGSSDSTEPGPEERGAPAALTGPSAGEHAAVLAELDALSCPEGTDPAVWAEIKAAMRVLLENSNDNNMAREAASLEPISTWVIPDAAGDKLAWFYGLRGDYDLNGEVNLSDLTPLGQYFGQSWTDTTLPGARIRWVDGDWNREVNIADLTVIGTHFGDATFGYEVFRSATPEDSQSWEHAATLDSSLICDESQDWPYVTYDLEPDHADYEYFVRYREFGCDLGEAPWEGGSTDPVPPPPTGMISGQVTGPDGAPLADVSVVAEGLTPTTTDANGWFSFEALTPGTAYNLGFDKPGYTEGSRRVEVQAQTTVTVNVQLLQRALTNAYNVSAGGLLSTMSEVQVTLPPDALVDSQGLPLGGVVNASVTYVDPTSPQALTGAPGDMSALQLDSTQTRLETYGMAEVRIEDGSGGLANLAPGMTAEMVFPIPLEDQASAPETIGLYAFDAASGQWIEEGQAAKSLDGQSYIGSVGHFSYWNCDQPINPTHIKVKVVNTQGEPVQGVEVTSAGVSYSGTTWEMTNANGEATFWVEQSAQERVSVKWMGVEVYSEIVSTPDVNYDASSAPQVAVLSLSAAAIPVETAVVSAGGLPVPYSELRVSTTSGLVLSAYADAQGVCHMLLPGAETASLAPYYNGQSIGAPLVVDLPAEADEVNLGGISTNYRTLPMARLSATPYDGVAPLLVSFDASDSTGEGALSFHWTASTEYDGNDAWDETTGNPVIEHLFTTPGHYYVWLEVGDSYGGSDRRLVEVCCRFN